MCWSTYISAWLNASQQQFLPFSPLLATYTLYVLSSKTHILKQKGPNNAEASGRGKLINNEISADVDKIFKYWHVTICWPQIFNINNGQLMTLQVMKEAAIWRASQFLLAFCTLKCIYSWCCTLENVWNDERAHTSFECNADDLSWETTQ